MLSAFLQGGSRWQNLPACHGTVTITIQEVGDCHSRPKCSGYFPLCLLGSQCNWTVDRVWHKKRSLMTTCSFLCKVVRRNEGVIFCRGVIFWYMLTGCDTVSQFFGHGKPTAWKAWKARYFYQTIWNFKFKKWDTFIKLSHSGEISTEDLEMIDHFVVLMYDLTCPHETVGKHCKYLFTQMNRTMYNCQPTRDALLQHFNRGMSQSDIWAH